MTDFTIDLEECLRELRNGGVILYPTDTIWGLGCDATNEKAVKKLMELKGKPPSKGLVILAATERDILQHTAAADLAVFDYLKTTQKPTTVIYEHGLGLADDVLSADGSIAIRLVGDEFCRHLVKRLQKPIVSTSANIHGEPSPQNFSEISHQIIRSVNYVVKYRQDDHSPKKASALVKWHNGNVQIIRA
jgi:L-threonylcarbamoyladenylate synthase